MIRDLKLEYRLLLRNLLILSFFMLVLVKYMLIVLFFDVLIVILMVKIIGVFLNCFLSLFLIFCRLFGEVCFIIF